MGKGMTYHIGLQWGSGNVKCWRNGHRVSTLTVYARRDIDSLPTDIHEYLGEFGQTKKYLRKVKVDLLAIINRQYGKSFTKIVID